jgi:hypothetical protein
MNKAATAKDKFKFNTIKDELINDFLLSRAKAGVIDSVEEDLKQIATVVAAFAYNTAQADAKLPRKEKK